MKYKNKDETKENEIASEMMKIAIIIVIVEMRVSAFDKFKQHSTTQSKKFFLFFLRESLVIRLTENILFNFIALPLFLNLLPSKQKSCHIQLDFSFFFSLFFFLFF